MTTTLSAKGQILIPERLSAMRKLKAGADFTVITRSNGDILLRPSRRDATMRRWLTTCWHCPGCNLDPERAHARDLDL